MTPVRGTATGLTAPTRIAITHRGDGFGPGFSRVSSPFGSMRGQVRRPASPYSGGGRPGAKVAQTTSAAAAARDLDDDDDMMLQNLSASAKGHKRLSPGHPSARHAMMCVRAAKRAAKSNGGGSGPPDGDDPDGSESDDEDAMSSDTERVPMRFADVN